MKIDRSNYEIWLIDWLDGNLSDIQVEEVILFLSHNPDLNAEFEDISAFSLKPVEKTFVGKKGLKKSTADLTELQFEYLCIASLENDLSDEQKAELEILIEQDDEKNKSFQFIQKMKLMPGNIGYPYKDKLIKKSILQNVIRISVIGLSAAAAIALLFTTHNLIPGTLKENSNNRLESILTPYNKSNTVEASSSAISNNLKNPILAASKTTKNSKNGLPSVAVTKVSVATVSDKVAREPGKDSLIRNPDDHEFLLSKINIPVEINLKSRLSNNSLISSNLNPVLYSYEEERSNVGRFISRNFREIFLKDKAPQESRLKGYEIAEVGVAGLNKLLGWEMAFDKNNDENGELKSVYFSSKILKFNTPVKKNETQP